MPSVFNHENNSCWGIRKPICDLFFNENNKLTTNVNSKLTVNGKVETKTVPTANYHVSSNAYYGYQRHVNAQSDSFECAMDTIENATPNVDSDVQMTDYDGPFELQYNGINLIKRKRNYQDISAIAFKRMRQEEPLTGILTPPVDHRHHQNYIHTDYPRCQMEYANSCEEESESCKSRLTRRRRRRTFMKKEDDDEDNYCLLNLEELLKQTHGCDLYNFNASYDL